MHSRPSAVYIITNQNKSVLYTGVTTDLPTRIYQHIHKTYPDSFSARYNLTVLIWYELYDDIRDAITREKQIKTWNRERKRSLISALNPGWDDLYVSEVSRW